MARTKIIATLGPAANEVGVLTEMIRAGLDVARLNLSHVPPGGLETYIKNTRQAAQNAGHQSLAIMLDTRGPEIRVGELPYGGVKLAEGQLVHLVPENDDAPPNPSANGGASPGEAKNETAATGDTNNPGAAKGGGNEEVLLAGDPSGQPVAVIPISYNGLPRLVHAGESVLLDDGNLALQVEFVEGPRVICRVSVGGLLKSRKRVSLPHQPEDLPVLSEADAEDLQRGLELGIDFVAASFVRNASDVLTVRRLIEAAGGQAGIVAKVENQLAVDRLDDILTVADGIMVARGDLGVELPSEEVPVLQKEIIRRCNRAGKPVIIATQMLESMVSRPRPTRAEASDVANAIFDGADAVMLSAETSIGKHPVEAVAVMSRIAGRAEQALDHEVWLEAMSPLGPMSVTDAISNASCTIAHKLDAKAIITATQSGHTARMVARYRPAQNLLAATPDAAVARRLALVWGVEPILITLYDSADAMRNEAIRQALRRNLTAPGDLVVFTAGVPIGVTGTTNLLQIHTVGEVVVRGTGVGKGRYTGPVRFISQPHDQPAEPGDVVVCKSTSASLSPLLSEAGALVVETGGLTSDGAVVGIHLGVPTIVGAVGALQKLKTGSQVTVDAQQGAVYQAEA